MKNEHCPLTLNDVAVRRPGGFPADRLLAVLGGRSPNPLWLGELARASRADVWAVDSGVEACRAAGLAPRLLIGDFDSAPSDALEWAVGRGAVTRRYPGEKDLTDFQLTLEIWRETDGVMPIVTGCFGGRLDHLFSNLQSFAMTNPQTPRMMIDEQEGVYLLYSASLATFCFRKKPAAISLLPLTDQCSGVSIEGVRWPLSGVTLDRRLPWAVSNRLEEKKGAECAKEVKVICGEGVMGVYWCFEA